MADGLNKEPREGRKQEEEVAAERCSSEPEVPARDSGWEIGLGLEARARGLKNVEGQNYRGFQLLTSQWRIDSTRRGLELFLENKGLWVGRLGSPCWEEQGRTPARRDWSSSLIKKAGWG